MTIEPKVYDVQSPPNPFHPFEASSFDIECYEHWIRTTRTYNSIILYTKNVQSVRSRILQYARKYDHVLETTKMSDDLLKITFTGHLYDN